MIDERPIGIFDSGIGGLTVVKEIMKTLPNEQIIYLGDTARVPYGAKSPKSVRGFTLQASLFLLEHNVKMIVIACNTASAVALDYLAKMFKIPFIGVIEPGALGALRETKNRRIGIIGTTTTIESDAYTNAIHKLTQDIVLFKKACPLFVPIAEEGCWLNHPVAKQITEEYLSYFKGTDIDTLILGCTHYPILKKIIQEVMTENVTLIDSGVEAARLTKDILERNIIASQKPNINNHIFYVTDAPDKFKKIGEDFLGKTIDRIGHVGLDSLIK